MSTGGEIDGTNDELGRWEFALPRKPDVVPSNVPYVSSARNPEAGIVSVGTPEFCKYEGFTLRGLLARLWNVPESRVAFRGSFDEAARFDVVLVPPDPERVDIDRLMRDGSFEVDVRVDGGVDALLAALRDIGIETTPSRRDVRLLVVRRR